MPIWKPKARHQCADCGVWEGELHRDRCTCELCPAAECPWTLLQCPEAWHQTLPREPFMLYPVLCARCGSPFPSIFYVNDTLWSAVVGRKYIGITLCQPCFRWMRRVVNHEVPLPEEP